MLPSNAAKTLISLLQSDMLSSAETASIRPADIIPILTLLADSVSRRVPIANAPSLQDIAILARSWVNTMSVKSESTKEEILSWCARTESSPKTSLIDFAFSRPSYAPDFIRIVLASILSHTVSLYKSPMGALAEPDWEDFMSLIGWLQNPSLRKPEPSAVFRLIATLYPEQDIYKRGDQIAERMKALERSFKELIDARPEDMSIAQYLRNGVKGDFQWYSKRDPAVALEELSQEYGAIPCLEQLSESAKISSDLLEDLLRWTLAHNWKDRGLERISADGAVTFEALCNPKKGQAVFAGRPGLEKKFRTHMSAMCGSGWGFLLTPQLKEGALLEKYKNALSLQEEYALYLGARSLPLAYTHDGVTNQRGLQNSVFEEMGYLDLERVLEHGSHLKGMRALMLSQLFPSVAEIVIHQPQEIGAASLESKLLSLLPAKQRRLGDPVYHFLSTYLKGRIVSAQKSLHKSFYVEAIMPETSDSPRSYLSWLDLEFHWNCSIEKSMKFRAPTTEPSSTERLPLGEALREGPSKVFLSREYLYVFTGFFAHPASLQSFFGLMEEESRGMPFRESLKFVDKVFEHILQNQSAFSGHFIENYLEPILAREKDSLLSKPRALFLAAVFQSPTLLMHLFKKAEQRKAWHFVHEVLASGLFQLNLGALEASAELSEARFESTKIQSLINFFIYMLDKKDEPHSFLKHMLSLSAWKGHPDRLIEKTFLSQSISGSIASRFQESYGESLKELYTNLHGVQKELQALFKKESAITNHRVLQTAGSPPRAISAFVALHSREGSAPSTPLSLSRQTSEESTASFRSSIGSMKGEKDPILWSNNAESQESAALVSIAYSPGSRSLPLQFSERHYASEVKKPLASTEPRAFLHLPPSASRSAEQIARTTLDYITTLEGSLLGGLFFQSLSLFSFPCDVTDEARDEEVIFAEAGDLDNRVSDGNKEGSRGLRIRIQGSLF